MSDLIQLEKILAEWARINVDHIDQINESLGITVDADAMESTRLLTAMMADRARPHLPLFLADNSHRTAEDLAEIASDLSPGGAHTGGLLVNMIRDRIWGADPLLVTAVIWNNWHGGKAGFQFLPDPKSLDSSAYREEVFELMHLLNEGLCGDPRRVLTGEDLTFFEGLPAAFPIYRGCSGITAEKAGHGVCWTTDRAQAEWFARRWSTNEAAPVLVSSRIKKEDAILAKHSESEVVTLPKTATALQID